MEKQISYGTEAREGVCAGVDKLARAVKTTLGAKGRNVLIGDLHDNDPHITKDGVTVAKSIELGAPLEGIGVKLMKRVALNTNDEVGDGTTTSIVLAQAILNQGLELINKGANPIYVKKGIDIAVAEVCKHLAKISKPLSGNKEFVKQIASISANNDSFIGGIIADAFEKVGKHGIIRIQDATNTATFITHEKGLQFDRGYINPYFATNQETGRAVLEDPFILITDYIIKDLKDFGVVGTSIPLFDEIHESGRPLLIICDDMEQFPMQSFITNKLKQSLISVVVKAPEFGDRRIDQLEDIATVTGGIYISKEKGHKLSELKLSDLGTAERVEVDDVNTSIIKGAGTPEAIKNRVDIINEKLKTETEEFAVYKLEERLAKLTGGVALINIGAKSEVELKELKDRVEDALSATKAAIAEGVVAGGGIALLKTPVKSTSKYADVNVGIEIIRRAIQTPFITIVENAGEDVETIKEKVLANSNKNYGYDVKFEKYGNMFARGVIDPVKVTRVALQNAASIAGTLLTTECVVTNDEIREKQPDFTI